MQLAVTAAVLVGVFYIAPEVFAVTLLNTAIGGGLALAGGLTGNGTDNLEGFSAGALGGSLGFSPLGGIAGSALTGYLNYEEGMGSWNSAGQEAALGGFAGAGGALLGGLVGDIAGPSAASIGSVLAGQAANILSGWANAFSGK